MFAMRHFLVFASLAFLVGCSDSERVVLSSQKDVEVSTNLPESLRSAVLYIKVQEPINPQATNYRSWSGSRSLNSPGGSSSGEDGTMQTWDGDQLIGIDAEGFKILFTKKWRPTGLRQKISSETNVILFRYGQITETNTLRWKIVGKFK